jgi:hypothetical protein
MRAARPLLVLIAPLVLALTAAALVSPPAADAVTRWAPLATASVRPGVQMYTGDAQCTADFVFTDTAGDVFVGYAAHCAGKGSESDTNGCTTRSNPVGTAVAFVRGGGLLSAGTTVAHGRLVYSSWLSMQRRHTTGLRCIWNDFALVKVNVADRGKVNPTVPGWGGPRTFGGSALPAGAKLFTVGSSALRGGKPSPKTGSVIARDGGGLGYDIRIGGGGGVPGDSGSGFLDATGRAIGVLSTLSVGFGLGPGAGITNTIGDLAAEIGWARLYSGIPGLRLVAGTVPFSARGGVG